jgi:hypothetical protein
MPVCAAGDETVVWGVSACDMNIHLLKFCDYSINNKINKSYKLTAVGSCLISGVSLSTLPITERDARGSINKLIPKPGLN